MSYLRGTYKQLCCSLIDELRKQGIAAVVGRTGKKAMVAYVREEDVWKVPREWRGHKVAVHVDNELASAVSGDANDPNPSAVSSSTES